MTTVWIDWTKNDISYVTIAGKIVTKKISYIPKYTRIRVDYLRHRYFTMFGRMQEEKVCG